MREFANGTSAYRLNLPRHSAEKRIKFGAKRLKWCDIVENRIDLVRAAPHLEAFTKSAETALHDTSEHSVIAETCFADWWGNNQFKLVQHHLRDERCKRHHAALNGRKGR